jgi:hypothetical protein
MPYSLPSKKSLFLDVPRGAIQNFKGQYIYNFFMPDEDINEQPQNALPNIIKDLVKSETKNVSLKEALKQKKNERYVPRYINLMWDRVPNIGNNPRLIQTVSIADNLSKVLDEEKIAGQFFTSVKFKDNGSDGKIQYSIRRAMEEILKTQNINANDIAASPLDLVKLLNSYTSNQIDGNFLAESFINYNAAGVNFIDREKYDDVIETTTERLKQIGLRANINNKVISLVLKSGAQQVDNIFADETLGMMPAVEAIQERAIAESVDSIRVDVADYIINIEDYINWQPISALEDYEYQLVGYIIDKKEYPKNNPEIYKETIVIENPAIANFTDLSVKYGTIYGYTIRSVFLVKLVALDTDTDTLGVVSFLVSSQPGAEIYIQTKETRPPNPPTDFNITWDYEKNQPYLTWNFPTDSQRDTKYFQIFKRNSIRQPFRLQKMYNFNDSNTPIDVRDMAEANIDSRLIEILRRPDGTTVPKNFYYDTTFTKEETAIYAVCSVDAHGYTSNYSTQIEITFDQIKNRLNKRLISIAGAPKPYPNFYYNQDLFVDSIKTSGAKNLHVYFNPEFLKLNDRDGNDLGLIKTDANSAYKLQLINIDLQKDKIINIKIDKVEDPVPLGNNVEPSVNSRIQVSKLENPDT